MLSDDRVRNNVRSPYDLFVQLVKGLHSEGVRIMLRDYDFNPGILYRGDSQNNIILFTLIGVKALDEQKYRDKIYILYILNLLLSDKRIDITIDNDRLVQADIIIDKTIESFYQKIENLENLKDF